MDWIAYLTAGGIGGGIVQIFRVVLDHRRGVKADERDAKKEARQLQVDAATGFDKFADNLQESLAAERARLDALQVRVDVLSSKFQRALDFIAQLRQDITDGRPPPPREWPEGIFDEGR